MENLGVIFLTGLTVGGLTCLAVQGGLLASVIAAREDEVTTNTRRHALFATAAFLTSKFFAYTVLGGILGLFGGAISISPTVQTIMQLAAGVYMVAVACNLLDIHPLFRYAVIQPPKVLTRLVRNQAKSKDLFAPVLLGAMTIFIPCGTTVAMETVAISSAHPVSGALIMATFILGTIPLFFGIGVVTSLLGEAYKTKFLKLAACFVLYLGLTSINGSLVALGSPVTAQSIAGGFASVFTQEERPASVETNQNPTIAITSYGYEPSVIRVKKNEPVTLTLKSTDAFSCALAFRIPSLNIKANLKANDTKIVTFTPTSAGTIPFSCAMGMYTGKIEVY